jgi:hypothetical protein
MKLKKQTYNMSFILADLQDDINYEFYNTLILYRR